MPRWKHGLPASLAVAFVLAATSACDSQGDITSPVGNSIVTIDLTGLGPVGGGLNYQAWLVSQNATSLIGIPVVLFNIDDQGQMVDPGDGTPLDGPWGVNVPASGVLGVAVSLELTNQLVAYSSNTFILSGELIQGTANLTTADVLAFNQDFSGISGHYSLLTPTDEDAENELNGLWFMDPTLDPIAEGLVLPEAPVGWNYEGWIEVEGQAVSVGKFRFPNVADSSSAYSGSVTGPSFPGEDFLNNAPAGLTFPLDLSGAAVYVTLEPWMDFDTDQGAPFFLKILEGQVPAEPVSLTLYDLTSLANQLPSGTVTVQDAS